MLFHTAAPDVDISQQDTPMQSECQKDEDALGKPHACETQQDPAPVFSLIICELFADRAAILWRAQDNASSYSPFWRFVGLAIALPRALFCSMLVFYNKILSEGTSW